jgi:hypothetical protein
MKEKMFIQIHYAADRVALEAARKTRDEGQEDRYISVYGKVLDYLVGVFEKADIED